MENSSVILDNNKKKDRVRYGSVKESGLSDDTLVPNSESRDCYGIFQLSKVIK